ncbi:MAG: TasA family protein [bacterium]|nr:TasA family protein [bacterium]
MKKILLSLITVAVVAATAFGVTRAFFTDTETNQGNTFSTGTIDIAVDGENPWSSENQFNLTDMKPSQVEYANFVIKNVGTNPANVTKRVDVTSEEDGIISEPECVFGGGTWTGESCTDEYIDQNDISSAIRYDLKVWVYDVDPTANPEAQPKWWQYIYTDDMNKRLNTLNGQNVLLGMVPAGWWMKVEQSYHMDSDTGNWAQGDVMTFNITLTAEQLKGTVLLENKNFADQTNPTIVHDDGIQGTLTYGVKDSKFNFSFTGMAPLANTNYSLVFYPETWSDPALNAPAWPRQVIVLANVLSDGSGNVTIPSTSTELNQNILNMKVWLVKTVDMTGDTLSSFIGSDYLFELGMMNYYDSDL